MMETNADLGATWLPKNLSRLSLVYRNDLSWLNTFVTPVVEMRSISSHPWSQCHTFKAKDKEETINSHLELCTIQAFFFGLSFCHVLRPNHLNKPGFAVCGLFSSFK